MKKLLVIFLILIWAGIVGAITDSDIITQYEPVLTDEASLYSTLSDVDLFLEDLVDDTTPTLGGNLAAGGYNITDLGDITGKTGASGMTFRTGTSTADKYTLQIYDVDDTTYRTVMEGDAGNDPYFQMITDYLRFENAADTTKYFTFDVSGISAGVPVTLTVPDESITIESDTHASEHATAGADPIAPSDIGAEPAGITESDISDLDHTPADDSVTDAKLATTAGFNVVIGGVSITAGDEVSVSVPYGMTITEYTILADASGSIQVDVWNDTYANYPPTDADTITASAPIAISSAVKANDSTLTGWTTAITAEDVLTFYVDSVTTITKVTIMVKGTR